METVDIYQEPNTLCKYDQKQLQSTVNGHSEAGLTEEAHCSRPAEDTQTATGQRYVNPGNSDKELFDSVSERLSPGVYS